ncbi:MAG: mevalonate kinase [Candidatus Aenigmarchaeota archaeon]|nr:mevalonate kinase [Candidatus Aenigmarchaeota archaeon]
MSEGYGYGKVILFGEHFVVYGIPAIASALSGKTIAKVEGSDKFELVDNRPETPGYKEKKKEQQGDSLRRILEFLKIDVEKNPIRITLSGDLVAASGVGASAASCAAIARAINEHFKLGLDDEGINKVAYEGEKGYHGIPSGIDNTAATYGGIILFTKGDPPKIERISMKTPIEIVEGNTGITSDTKTVVEDVARKKEENPQEFEEIFKRAKEITEEAKEALINADAEKIGRLMDENQELLRRIGVSCDELETLIKIGKDNGALGAKLTGTGRGGLMVSLTPGKELQERVANAMKENGFMAFRNNIG